MLDVQLTRDLALFIASQPTAEQILAFTASDAANERAYALIDAERERALTEAERQEIETYLLVQHIMILAKAEAHRKLHQRAS